MQVHIFIQFKFKIDLKIIIIIYNLYTLYLVKNNTYIIKDNIFDIRMHKILIIIK